MGKNEFELSVIFPATAEEIFGSLVVRMVSP